MPRNIIVISTNASWNIANFRMGLIGALQEEGHRVVAVAPWDAYADQLGRDGVEYHPIEMDKKGVSPVGDLLLLLRYYRQLRRIRPDVFLGYTVKPNIYGTLAARASGAVVINNVSGLGTAFLGRGMLRRIVSALYRIAFKASATVFFQNRDDRDLFLSGRILPRDRAKLLPGSGINLSKFVPPPARPEHHEGFRFLLIGRLLRDKGFGEYVEAARIVREQHPEAKFQLLGFLDAENRSAVSRAEVENWVSEGLIDYLGHSDDVRPFIAAADCVVLPSYREGLPRTLLEAAAMGKPLIATNVPGCKDVVEDGVNGFLCEVRSPESLAGAMLKMLRMPSRRREELGIAGRRKVEAEFDERLVIESYINAIRDALGQSP